MIYEEIPTYTDQYQSLDISIGGKAYTIKLKWNYSFKFWSIDMFDRDQGAVLYGVKLVKNTPLIHRFAISDLPTYGDILCVDTGNNAEEPTLDGLGVRFKLLYVDWTDDELLRNKALAEAIKSGSIWDDGQSIWDNLSAIWVE